jgi:hypothetical protein
MAWGHAVAIAARRLMGTTRVSGKKWMKRQNLFA